MWTTTYWLALLERAVKTFAQSLAALLVVDAAGAPLNWGAIILTASLATLASVLTSIATNAATHNGPGIGSAETINENFPDDPEGGDFDSEEFSNEELAEDDSEGLDPPAGFEDGSSPTPKGSSLS